MIEQKTASDDSGDGQTQSYTFDAMGNRLSRVDSASGATNYSYNAANMLLSSGGNAYTNDADGNTLTGGGRTNTWDSQNRLASRIGEVKPWGQAGRRSAERSAVVKRKRVGASPTPT